jgi:membrane-associated protein
MQFRFWLPLSALCILALFSALIEFNVIPPGLELLERAKSSFDDYFYFLIAFIILLESIVYIGFYFPGQFFAVVLVVMAKPQWQDIVYLTIAMVLAATLGSAINYTLGRWFSNKAPQASSLSLSSLLLAMIHINSLAFFMFSQGAKKQNASIILLAAGLNLPYYLLLIFATTLLSKQVLMLAENTWILAGFIGVWLAVTVFMDISKYRSFKLKQQ